MAKVKKKNKKKNKKKLIGFKGFFFLLCLVISMIMFMASTSVLLIGMIPTLVVYFFDQNSEKSKSLTVGALNFAGCFPYLIKLWTQENTMSQAAEYLSDPATIVVMYGAAAIGYLINWITAMIVSSLMMDQAKTRIKRIDKRKKELIERWGRKVDGHQVLDQNGFPIEEIIADEESEESASA